MKLCPVCQAQYQDDSLKFCLQDGAVLAQPLNEPETVIAKQQNGFNLPVPVRRSSAPIVAAILGGFVLLAAVVGGLGWLLFNPDSEGQTRKVEQPAVNRNDANQTNSRQTNAQIPSVEKLETNKNSASNVAQRPLPLQISASSSSIRRPNKGNFYFPNFAFDGNPETAWCEGVKGAGAGEWLQFDFGREVTLKQIKIQPGYFKNAESWAKNNRVAVVTLEFSDGTTRRNLSLNDAMQTQTLDVGATRTNSVKIKIEDYFPGASDSEDTLVSDVSFITN
jgi:hypothetical protein